jgi:hypothetical protein
MSVTLAPLPVQHFENSNGQPLVGGLLFTYAAGTLTPLPTYTDSTGLTPNTNPIVLNARGERNCWLQQGVAYKLILAPPGDTSPPTNPIWTVDNVVAPGAGGGSGNVPFISNLSALRGLTAATLASQVNVGGYATLGDAGAGTFTAQPLNTSSGWYGVASVAGTTLTLVSTTNGTLAIGQSLSAAGVPMGVYVTAGGGSSWTLSENLGTINSTVMAADNGGTLIVSYPTGLRWQRNYAYGQVDAGWFGVNASSLDNGPAFQATSNGMPQLGGNSQGTYCCAPGDYACQTPIALSGQADYHLPGVVMNYSGASSTATYVTLASLSTGDANYQDGHPADFGGLVIIGPGGSSSSTGLYLGGTIFHEKSLRNLLVINCGTGVSQNANAYNLKFWNCIFQANGIGVVLNAAFNNGESVEFHACTWSGSLTASLRSRSNGTDTYVFGGSFDQDVITAIDVAGNAIVSCFGTHFEAQTHVSGIAHSFVQNVSGVGNPVVNLHACTYTVPVGNNSSTPYIPLIDADQIHCNIFGGWINVAAGTQSQFVSSTGAYVLNVVNPLFIGAGSLATMSYIVGGTGQKCLNLNTLLNSSYTLGNNYALQANDNTNTPRNLALMDSSNNTTYGNSQGNLTLTAASGGQFAFAGPSTVNTVGSSAGLYMPVNINGIVYKLQLYLPS